MVLDDLDSSLFQDARDLKSIIFNSKDTLEEFKSALNGQNVQAGLKLVRNVFVIASGIFFFLSSYLVLGLTNSKEQKDIFLNIYEKITEPALSIGWTCNDLETFFNTLLSTFAASVNISTNIKNRYSRSFVRVVSAFKLASIRFYGTL